MVKSISGPASSFVSTASFPIFYSSAVPAFLFLVVLLKIALPFLHHPKKSFASPQRKVTRMGFMSALRVIRFTCHCVICFRSAGTAAAAATVGQPVKQQTECCRRLLSVRVNSFIRFVEEIVAAVSVTVVE